MGWSLATMVISALVAAVHWTIFSDNVPMDQSRPDRDEAPELCRRDALEKEFPWMASLHFNNQYICNSFLVTPNVLMTAAHCVFNSDLRKPEVATSFTAYIGTNNINGPGTKREFSEIFVHPQYDVSGDAKYDIAIMFFVEPVVLSDAIQAICLPTEGSLYEDMSAQVMGWGGDGRLPNEFLKTAPERILSDSQGVISTRKYVCIGERLCFANSGGPLVDLNGAKPVAIGISSSSSLLGCANPLVPGVYAATASHTDWISEVAKDSADLCFVNRTSMLTRR